jgi:hypothetical protein
MTKKLDSLKIGAIRYKVAYVPSLQDDGRPLDGQINHDSAEIHIEANMNQQVKVQTLLHEIIHGIEVQAGRRRELKEPMVDALAFGIYQVMRDNPELVRMIRK